MHSACTGGTPSLLSRHLHRRSVNVLPPVLFTAGAFSTFRERFAPHFVHRRGGEPGAGRSAAPGGRGGVAALGFGVGVEGADVEAVGGHGPGVDGREAD